MIKTRIATVTKNPTAQALRMLRRPYRRLEAHMFSCRLDALTRSIEVPTGIDLRMVDIGSMSHIARFGVSEEKARERFSRGDLCYVAYKEGTAVNINWVHRGACYITSFGYYHNIGQNDYYIYNVSTHHTERKKGYYKIALELLARELRELGGRNVTQLINSKNYIALDTVNKLGYDKEKVLIFEELLFVKKAIVRDMRTQEEDQHIFLFHPIHEISI